jgi:polyferredoxin
MDITSQVLILTMLAGLSLAGILVIFIWMRDRARKVSYLRIFVQIVSEFAIFYIITYEKRLGLVLVTVLLVTLVFGRFFCSWICPFGFYMDLVTLLRKSFKKHYLNLPERLNRNLHRLRYAILAMILLIPFFSGPLYPQSWILAMFLRGPFNPLRILLGPLVPLIVPWAGPITLSGLNLNYPYMDQIVYYSSAGFDLINVLIFVVFTVASSFAVRRFWCRFCPTGASIAIVNRFNSFKWAPVLHINKDEEKCTKCGVCKRVCPLQVTEVYAQKGGKITTSMCMLCFRCVEMCPYEDTLKVKLAGKTVFKSRNWLEPSEND